MVVGDVGEVAGLERFSSRLITASTTSSTKAPLRPPASFVGPSCQWIVNSYAVGTSAGGVAVLVVNAVMIVDR